MTVHSIVQKWEQKPFQRGTTDCCAFVDHVLKELTGESYLPKYGEDFEDILNIHGSLEQAVNYYLGQDPVDVEDLKPGDVVLVEVMDHQSIGVLLDNGNVAAIFEMGGLREIRPDFIDKGWSIGRHHSSAS